MFVAGPLTKRLDPETKLVPEKDIRRIKRMKEFLVGKGHGVFNAHTQEGFGANSPNPDVFTKRDFDDIKNCDLLLAYPASRATYIELGWATAWDKKIILLLRNGRNYSSMVKGLLSFPNVTGVKFSDEDDLYPQLEKLL